MAQIEGELQRLNAVVADNQDIPWTDMIAEEVVARGQMNNFYEWDENKFAAKVELPSGLSVSVAGDEPEAKVRLRLSWTSSGEHSRKRVIKWLPGADQKVESILQGAGWSLIRKGSWGEQVEFLAEIATVKVRARVNEVSKSFDDACEALRFD